MSSNSWSALCPLSSMRLSSTAMIAVPETVFSGVTSTSMLTLKHPASRSAIAPSASSLPATRTFIPSPSEKSAQRSRDRVETLQEQGSRPLRERGAEERKEPEMRVGGSGKGVGSP